MRKNITLALMSALLGVVACGDDGGDPASDASIAQDSGAVQDAATGMDSGADSGAIQSSLNCGNAAIPDPLTLAGIVEDIVGSNAASGVTLEVYAAGNPTPLSSVISDPNGNYNLSIPTGGAPWRGEIRATSDDYIDMHVYPSGLVSDFNDLNIPAVTPAARSLAGTLAGIQIGANDALVIGFIFDCDEQGLEGAAMTTDLASGDILYLLDQSPYVDTNRTTTAASGVGIVLNAVANPATPGKAKVGASYGDRTWDVDVDIIPGELSIALFIP